jgi:hypothetical protein
MNVDDLLREPPYALRQATKEEILLEHLTNLGDYHRSHCKEYARLSELLFPNAGAPSTLVT